MIDNTYRGFEYGHQEAKSITSDSPPGWFFLDGDEYKGPFLTEELLMNAIDTLKRERAGLT